MGGGTPVGPKAWQEWNVNELTDLSNFDEISGFPVYKVLLCDVEKVESRPGVIQNIPESGSKLEVFGQNIEKVDYSRFTRTVYLDNNATTPIADEVRETMMPYLGIEHGNPSSIYRAGLDAKSAVDRARRQIASLINVQPRRIIFTSGGSEADNMAIKGIIYSAGEKSNHIITTTIEHPAVLNTCRFLESIGFRVTYLDVDEYGLVDPVHLKNALTDKTVLVTIMTANNEVGTIQHIKELCEITHEKGVLFHTDAVQAIGKIKVDIQDTDVDLLSVSAHKFHGPKGIGALYVRKGIDLEPLIHGGKQESGFRAGTENVASIVGMGKAAELARYSLGEMDKVKELRDNLYQAITSLIPGARLNGHPEERLPNTLNLTLPGMRGESIVIALDHYGIALSSGSACKSGSPEPTHVLIAMGRTEEEAHCSVRFSLSRYNTGEDITQTIAALEQVLKDKEIVRLMPCK
jgi:cysteine desulfurase NifS